MSGIGGREMTGWRLLRVGSISLLALSMAIIAMMMVLSSPPASAGGTGISVTKFADQSELPPGGGEVTFTVEINNFVNATVLAINDSVFGKLINPDDPRITASTCEDSSAQFYSCTFTAQVSQVGFESHVNHVQVQTFNGVLEETNSFPVTIDFVGISATKTAFPSSLPAAGGDVAFTYGVTNAGSTSLTLSELTDDVFGDLAGSGTCFVPQTLAPGASYSCTVTETLPAGTPGTPHENTFTATADRIPDAQAEEMAELQEEPAPPMPVTASATASVDYLTTGITASKMAAPTSVPESGGDVTFTFGVTNAGEIDVVVDSLVDDVLGDLNGQGDCVVGETVAPAATYSCTVVKTLSGSADQPHVNTLTASATTVDTTTLEENVASATASHQATASATVTFIAPTPTPEPTTTTEPTATPLPAVGRAPLQPSPQEPTSTPTPEPTPEPVTTPVEEVVGLAHTANESTVPAALAVASIGIGTLMLGILRRSRD